MAFVKKTNDVHFRHNRCTPTQPLNPPKPSRSLTPYNAFKSDPQRKYGSTQLSAASRRNTMQDARDAQRTIPKYDTMRVDRRNRLEGLAGYNSSERPGPPRGAPPPLPGTSLPGMKFAPNWQGPLGYEGSANGQKLARRSLAQSADVVAKQRMARAKGVRSRNEPSRPLRGQDQNIGGMSPRTPTSGRRSIRGKSPRAPNSGSANGRSPRDVLFTTQARRQLSGKARSSTPGNSLDMRGSENAFNEKGAKIPSGRRTLTMSAGGIAPDLNGGVPSLLPFVLEENVNKKLPKHKRGSGTHIDKGQVYGSQKTNTHGQPYLNPTILSAAAQSPRNRTNSVDGTQTKLFGGHLKDVDNDRWKLIQRDARMKTVDPTTKHNHDMISGVFEMLDNDGSNFIDMVELQKGLSALKLNATKGAVDQFVEIAAQLDKEKNREHKRGQVGYKTWCDLIASRCRGDTLGNMRGATLDSKHKNYQIRQSHMENVGRGVVDGGLSNLRPGHYTNTALFSSGYSRFNREEMFQPNETEAVREGVHGNKVYDPQKKEWIEKSQARNPKPSRSLVDVNDANQNEKKKLLMQQQANQKKIKELRRRLNQGGTGEEKKPHRWGGTNRFDYDKMSQQRAIDMEIADEKQRMDDAATGGSKKMHGSDLFFKKAERARGKSRTPNVWNKLINPDGL